MDGIWKVSPIAVKGFWNLTPVLAQAMTYVDDILIGDSREALQASLAEWNKEPKIRILQIKVKLYASEEKMQSLLGYGKPLELMNT